MDRLSRSAALALVCAVSCPAGVRAGGPSLEVHGTLADAQGNPISGIVALDFTLIDMRGPANEVWSENQHVRVDDGSFSAVLGEIHPFPPLSEFRSGWKLLAEAPMYSRWKVTVTDLQRQTAARRRQWAELMEHFEDEAPAPSAPVPASTLVEPRSPHPIGWVVPTIVFPAAYKQAEPRLGPQEAEEVEREPASDARGLKRDKKLERVLAREASLIRASLGRLAGDYRDRRFKSTPLRAVPVRVLAPR